MSQQYPSSPSWQPDPTFPASGASGANGPAATTPSQARSVRPLAMMTIAVAVLLLLARLALTVLAFLDPGNSSTAGGIVADILSALNLVLAIVVFGLGIALTVVGRRRGRVGGVIVLISEPLGLTLSIVLGIIVIIIATAMNGGHAPNSGSIGTWPQISSLIFSLLLAAVQVGGGLMALKAATGSTPA